MNRDLMNLLSYELGEILLWEEECPGVYYLSAIPPEGSGHEYYVVLDEAPISQVVRSMGHCMEGTAARTYQMEAADGAWTAVEFEVLKYKTARGLPLSKSLREAALYGMELYLGYFGTHPEPLATPWGNTLRHRRMDEGIFWIETDRSMEVLAVSHPVWATELSEGLLSVAGKLDYEGEMGCRYFNWQTSCAVLFELLPARPALVSTGMIRRAELMNAIWERCPEYAVAYNAWEQAGLNDVSSLLLHAMGVEGQDLKGSPENMIAMMPRVGTDFIGE